MRECSLCGREVDKYKRIDKGKGYCGTCYAYLFKKRECSVCGKMERINKYDETPICRSCKHPKQPCIRCGKEDYKIGKIIDAGPVCKSCSVYYRPERICNCCGKPKKDASRRLALDIHEPICDQCLNKKIGVKCNHCKSTRPAYIYTLDKKPVCRLCATKPDKACNQCGASIPAGISGNICFTCSAKTRLKKRLAFSSKVLSPEVAKIYDDYGNWMANERDPAIASRKIISSFEIFKFLSDWHEKYGALPSYNQYASKLTVAKTRQHLTVTYFLDQAGLIPLDHAKKKEIGSLDCIDRAYDRIPKSHPLFAFMDSFYHTIQKKYEEGKNTAHSARLAFGSAVNMLELGVKQNKPTPDIELIRQYLWLHIGQKASLSAFIGHLNRTHDMNLPSLNGDDYELRLERHSESAERSKQKLIRFLRSENDNRDLYIELGLAYYHKFRLPSELKCLVSSVGYEQGGWLVVKLAREQFAIPILGKD